ncbi:MAG TPA: alpha/beta fold hydrolase [Patescibacteria group bacterium]|nr:alpha/beta fold hydrolase [Patescibacteria group bacterium]
MMLKRIGFIVLIVLFLVLAVFLYATKNQKTIPEVVNNIVQPTPSNILQIAHMRDQNYPGSSITISQTLSAGSNYKRYIAYYYSDNLKIYGLLTVPNSTKPIGGFPAIIFNHGYITPQLYTPDGNYVAYVDALTKAGYVVFKPDYRGNGKSQGDYGSEYFSRNYDIDDLNAIASIEKFDEVNPGKIGIWGHSMGGHITLMDLEIAKNIKAAVIWGGVVGSYNDILYNWQNRVSYQPDAEDLRLRNQGSEDLVNMYGTPTQNPSFWNSIDPTTNLNYINTPLQIHVGAADNQVPPDFGENLYNDLKSLGKTTEFYSYPGANHDISSPSFETAMARTISFFDKYLK